MSLQRAELQGASLKEAQLQGASLPGADLQGSSPAGAELQGATARPQGASLAGARLQGASLERAILAPADLRGAYLWRANRATPPSTVADIRMYSEHWFPGWYDWEQKDHPWDGEAYNALRITIESLPPGPLRDHALERIRSLDCSDPDKTLASCNPSAAPPPEVVAWLVSLDNSSVGAYAFALAKTLKELVCSGDDNAIYILRGIIASLRSQ